jgi:hypothetical protein
MSKKTVSQMEAALMDNIEKSKTRLIRLQQKHKLEIGNLAYKHGLNHLPLAQLNLIFSNIAEEEDHDNT